MEKRKNKCKVIINPKQKYITLNIFHYLHVLKECVTSFYSPKAFFLQRSIKLSQKFNAINTTKKSCTATLFIIRLMQPNQGLIHPHSLSRFLDV